MAKKRILPKSNRLALALVASILLQVVFVFLLTALDILPFKFYIAVIAVIVAVDVITVLLMNNRKKKSKKPIIGLVLAMIMMIIMALGSFYMFNTAETLINISNGKGATEKYHVIVIKESKYENVNQIAGEEVYILDEDSKMYNEAQQKLLTKVKVDYAEEADITAVSEHLMDSKGKMSDEIIFISGNSYDILCENNKEFKKNTEKLYSVEVVVKSDDFARRINVTEDPFNIYISGIDLWGEIEQVSRSDVNMIVTVNPQTREILLTSMPRDSYVPLAMNGQYDKLTHSGVYGIEETIATVENWLDVDINYYVRANFSMIVDLVNAIGGITVESDFAFKSKVSKYTYVVGENEMDGKAALYFARERKAFEDEDEERIRNQQKVLKAILQKMTKSEVILTNYVDILEAVEGHMETNMSNKEISSLVKMQLNDMDTGWKIKTISIDGVDSEKGTWSMGPGKPLFVS
ncbi:MAG: LCP family protein, partial [Bacillota bacterium]|nr:LCP family protein [Bacillota bacterium]